MQNEKDNLILLTNYFPFWKGEEYLEAELPYLSENFDKVYIIPVMVNKNMKQTREIPDNVELINVKVDHSLKGKIKMMILNRNHIEKMMLTKKTKFLEKIYEFYFIKRSKYISKLILKQLEGQPALEGNVSIYSYWFYITAMVGIEIATVCNGNVKKIISRAHGYDVNQEANFLKFLPCREYLLKNTDKVYPVSSYGERNLITQYPEFSDKISVRRLGVNSIRENKSFTGAKNKKMNVFVSCSTIRPLKRLEIIIDALSELEKVGVSYKWIHVGTGKNKYVKKIEDYARSKLNSSNYIFKGYIKNEDIPYLYMEEDVSWIVNVSSSEGVPVSIMEAFSMSIPAIATNVGGTSDIVVDKENGFLLSKDIGGKDLFLKLLEIEKMDDSVYQKYKENAYLKWNTQLNVEKNYREFALELKE